MFFLFLVASEDTQQVEEEVDEVEIQSQGSDESQLLSALAHIVLCLEHHLDLLAVPGCQTYEDGYTRIAQDVFKSGTLQEHINYGGNNQTNQRHKENLAERGEILLGGVSVEGHRSESAGGDEEDFGNAGHCIYCKYRR